MQCHPDLDLRIAQDIERSEVHAKAQDDGGLVRPTRDRFLRPITPRIIVRGCFIVLMIHIAVDSFIDVRPGTSAIDHLVSGVVPLVTLAVVGVIADRATVRTSTRITSLLGLSVIIGGVGAPIHELLGGEVRPGTITGLSATLVGALLVVLGVVSMVRRRGREESRQQRWLRRARVAALGVASIVFLAVPLGMGYVAANRTYPPDATPDLGVPHVDVALPTDDGIRLAASYVPSRNGAAIIVFPGRSGGHVTSRARMLVEHGYGVLLLERRGHGASEGDPNLVGWSEEPDLRAAIDYLEGRPDVVGGRIGGIGLSLGGEMMIQTAAHDPRLAAVVSEGAGTRWVAEDLRTPFPGNLIQVPLSAALTVSTAIFSDSTPPPRLENLIDDISPRPIMLIWTRRGLGGEQFNPLYHEQAGDNATIWEIPDGGHTDGLSTRPIEYEDRVVHFFDLELDV